MQIISASDFGGYWKLRAKNSAAALVDPIVGEIIEAVRIEGDAAVRRYAGRFDKASPERLEVPVGMAAEAWDALRSVDREIAAALELSARHIFRFAQLQMEQMGCFEQEMEKGLYTGQLVIPVERAGVYIPGGRYPLFSSVLMGMIPALAAGVDELVLASPPMEDGFPNRNILAASALSVSLCNEIPSARNLAGKTKFRVFSAGGAQAIAAMALGTETIPRVDIIAGPGNKYVAAAKRMLFGQVGIDLIAGPTDVLVIADNNSSADLIAADMLAQAEHDAEAAARALVPSRGMAEKINAALGTLMAPLPQESRNTANASLDANGLVITYGAKEEAVQIANTIAPEHLELHCGSPESWLSPQKPGMPYLRNFGSLFIGPVAAEVLGDYSAGINHTLPTAGSARFTGGLSVRHFLKIPTTLRCAPGPGYDAARQAAETLGQAEGLAAHSLAAAIRRQS